MIRRTVHDPETAEALSPRGYPLGCQRPVLDTNYFETFNRDDVSLVDLGREPIVEVEPTGIRTANRFVELDVLVLATGFDAGSGALTRIDIRGRGGRSLKDEWAQEIRTTMGLQVHGYPNLFTTGAPLAPSAALCNMTTCLQQQVDWITGCLLAMRDKGQRVIEPSRELQDAWVAHHDETANATLVVKTDSWYMGSNVPGKPRRLLSYRGGVGNHRSRCEEVAASGYAGFVFA